MKKTLLNLLGFLLAGITSTAQPVLTAATNAPVVGDILALQNTKIDGISIPSDGINQNWDYSSIVDSGALNGVHYIDAAGTKYASLFPGATLLDTAVISGNTSYRYYQTGNTVALHGNATPTDTAFFLPALTIVQFPVAYGYSKSDYLDVHYHHGTIDTAKWIQHATVDGWGTLKLPDGTFDVLRVLLIDSIGYKFGGFGYVYQELSRQIVFFTPGYHGDLLNFGINPNGTVRTVQYAKNVSLPVNLAGFSGKLSGSQTQLQWQTTNESGLSSFNVQRSTDAVHFTDISAIKANGTAGSYDYSDNVAGLSVSRLYYRLQQVDKNGKVTYSNTIVITVNGKGTSFTILPNPVRNYFTIFPDAALTINNATLTVRDMAGNTVLRQKLSNNGEQKINVASLSKGVYMATINTPAGGVHSKKIVKE